LLNVNRTYGQAIENCLASEAGSLRFNSKVGRSNQPQCHSLITWKKLRSWDAKTRLTCFTLKNTPAKWNIW